MRSGGTGKERIFSNSSVAPRKPHLDLICSVTSVSSYGMADSPSEGAGAEDTLLEAYRSILHRSPVRLRARHRFKPSSSASPCGSWPGRGAGITKPVTRSAGLLLDFSS